MYSSPYDINYSQREAHSSETSTLFTHRWSPRSFQKKTLPKSCVESLFDAARFAPSAYNEQPWRIFASTEETFDGFLNLLNSFNQEWAKNASIIGFMIAQTVFEKNGKANPTALYDCGSAWMAMTIQARKHGLYTHGMAGIKYDEIYEHFEIPKEKYTVIAGFAIGVLDAKENLPEKFQATEEPSARKPLHNVYFPGGTKLQ